MPPQAEVLLSPIRFQLFICKMRLLLPPKLLKSVALTVVSWAGCRCERGQEDLSFPGDIPATPPPPKQENTRAPDACGVT